MTEANMTEADQNTTVNHDAASQEGNTAGPPSYEASQDEHTTKPTSSAPVSDAGGQTTGASFDLNGETYSIRDEANYFIVLDSSKTGASGDITRIVSTAYRSNPDGGMITQHGNRITVTPFNNQADT
ncbi:uncharacterized protein IL334_003858 [Kwoniella shivajii]|uniref:Uncharacterized protein n=1 Tax=Kwoniella shivajii TaxID=564305 RepID=A0ABZ1CYS5_9TREE|nr:hypothetical protein IL334_003858 [Kwoniella shivajii]